MIGDRVPLSLLDLAFVSTGSTSARALANTTALAQRADELGYSRFWVAEHHNMSHIASTSPPLLVAHLAAATRGIRVGSGGVMLPNHPALVVAEQFAMLEALHSARIDLGIGRAPGTDPATAAELRRSPAGLNGSDFLRQLLDLMGLLGDKRGVAGSWQHFTATPVAQGSPTVLLLGSSGNSAELAGKLGLPFAFAHHFDAPDTTESLRDYRKSFVPSAALSAPHSIVTASVLVADTDEEARWLSGPGLLMRLAARNGQFNPLLSPAQAAAHRDIEAARSARPNLIAGSADTAVARLAELVDQTGADEIMIDTETYGLADRIRSIELLAEHWSLAPR